MLKRLAQCVREYKRATILTIIFIVCEVIIEVFLPFITADLINSIKDGADMGYIIKIGVLLIGMALLSLACGGIAGVTCAKASAGFAKNLRRDIFHKIQTYSFENIDKFSSSSLVTRMTTDVVNAQMAFMMVIRIAIRAPLMFIFAIVMAYIMGGALATSFVVIVPLLIFGLWLISRKAMPAFRAVFKKYDKMNESIEENVRGMRVVKGFSRESYEKEKFKSIYKGETKDGKEYGVGIRNNYYDGKSCGWDECVWINGRMFGYCHSLDIEFEAYETKKYGFVVNDTYIGKYMNIYEDGEEGYMNGVELNLK